MGVVCFFCFFSFLNPQHNRLMQIKVRVCSRIKALIPVCFVAVNGLCCGESPIKCVCAAESDTFATADKPEGSLKTHFKPSKAGKNEGLLGVIKPKMEAWKSRRCGEEEEGGSVAVSLVSRSLSVALTHWPSAPLSSRHDPRHTSSSCAVLLPPPNF